MRRKIFISYKYKDEKVKGISSLFYDDVDGVRKWVFRKTRVRDYVDKLQDMIGKDNINLGEKDGESLDEFSDEQIEGTLKKRIRQCSVTIVLISKGMKTNESEREQWIPWEISYSLRTVPYGKITKQMNAVLGIVLPDETGAYDWYYTSNYNCNSITHHTHQLFEILKNNMFNIIEKQFRECDGSIIHTADEPSFIKTVKWDDFISNNNQNIYIEKAIEIKNKLQNYDMQINLK